MGILELIKNKAQQALQGAGNFIDQDDSMGGVQLAQGGLLNRIKNTPFTDARGTQTTIGQRANETYNNFNTNSDRYNLFSNLRNGNLNAGADIIDKPVQTIFNSNPAKFVESRMIDPLLKVPGNVETALDPNKTTVERGIAGLSAGAAFLPGVDDAVVASIQAMQEKAAGSNKDVLSTQYEPTPLGDILRNRGVEGAPATAMDYLELPLMLGGVIATGKGGDALLKRGDELLPGVKASENVVKLPKRPASTMYTTPEGITFKVNRQPKTTASLDEVLGGVEQATGKEITQFTKPTSYKRGDITKIQKQLDELLGTDSFRFNNKWQSVSPSRDAAIKQAEYYASTGDPDAVAYLDEIRSLMNKLDDARAGVTTPPQPVPTGIKPADKTVIETKALPAGEQPLALPVGDQSNLTITQIKKMADAGSDTSGVTFTAKNADEARQAIKAGLKPEQVTVAKKTAQSGDSLIFPQEEAALRNVPRTGVTGVEKKPLNQLWDDVVKPSKEVIGQTGPSGARIKQTLQIADEEGALTAGSQIDEMYRSLKNLTPEDKKTFADVVEGRLQPTSEQQAQAVQTWRNISADIYKRGKGQGLDVGFLDAYFPHNVIQDASGKVASGPMARTAPRRFGNLELSRQTDLPYDKDPSVLFGYIESANKRIAEAKHFGPQDEILYNLANNTAKEGGDPVQITKYLDQILGKNQDTAWDKASEGVRSYQTISKLNPGTSVTNLTQSLSTMLKTDVPTTLKSIQRTITNPELAFSNAMKAGEITPEMARVFEDYAGKGNLAQKWIKMIGMLGTEKVNRVIAVNAGMEYTEKLASKALLGDKAAIRELERIGLSLTDLNPLKGGRNVSLATQFSTAPGELPYAWKTALGKVMTQFKSFAYKQSGFLKDEAKRIIIESKNGNFKPLVNALTTYGVAAPIVGEVVADIKSVLTNKKRESKLFSKERYVENILAATSFGMFDMIPAASGQFGASGVIGTVAGPMASDIYKGAETITGATSGDKYEQRKAARNVVSTIPVVGKPISNTFIPNSYVDNIYGGVNEGMNETDTKTYNNLKQSDPQQAELFKEGKIQQRNTQPNFLEKMFGGDKKVKSLSPGATPEEQKAFNTEVQNMLDAGGVPDDATLKQYITKGKDFNSSSIEERTKAFSGLQTAMKNEYYSEEQKQAILKASGVRPEDYDYFELAGKDQDVRLQEMLSKFDNMDTEELVTNLMKGRRVIAGKQLVSNAMVDYLFENDYIGENEKEAIKALKFDEIKNEFYFSKSFAKKGSGMTYKQAKALYKMDMPKFSTLKDTGSLLKSMSQKITQTGGTNDKLLETILTGNKPARTNNSKLWF